MGILGNKISALIIGAAALFPVSAMSAELLDVKPVSAGDALSFEVSADVPMTYTYYRIPGEARGVLDIADADPEKIDAIIVVNKGLLSSIGVDKVNISGMTVSRLIFNLAKPGDLSVAPDPSRKKLTVTFSQIAGAASAPPPAAEPVAEEAKPAAPPEPVKQPEPVKENVVQPAAVQPEKAASPVDDDPLGLNEVQPQAKAEPAPAKDPVKPAAIPVPVSTPKPAAIPSPQKAVPAAKPAAAPQAASAQAPVIKSVHMDTGYLEIQSGSRISDYKVLKLTSPERLVIDIKGARKSMSAKSLTMNRNGIAQVRFGTYQDSLRVVLDASGTAFPPYEVSPSEKGLRVIFTK